MQDIKLGKSGDLDLRAAPSAVTGLIGMAAALTAVGVLALKLTFIEAIIGGLAATGLHFASELYHQQGHARAGRTAGYPMTGARFWLIFAQSLYPPDEPELPAEIHIRRALGGPINSAIITVMAGLLLYITKTTTTGVVWNVFVFFFLDNLLVFTLGSFLPLGFTDGSTLLHWWPKLGR